MHAAHTNVRAARPTPRQRGVVLALAAWLLLSGGLVSAARAQAAGGESDEARYKELIHEALQEYQMKHWTEARSLMEAAHALSPSARTLRGLAMVAFELRDYADAVELIEQALADERKPLSAAQREDAEALRQRARRYVGHYRLELHAPVSEPRLEVDGRPARRDAEGRLVLVAGEHVLTVHSDGAAPVTRHIDVRGGEEETLRFELSPLRVESAGAEAASGAPHAPDDAQDAREAEIARRARAGRRWGLGLGLAGAGLIALGSATGVVALTSTESNPDLAKTLSVLTDVTLGLGVVAAAAGLSVWLVRRDRRPASGGLQEAQLRPRLAPTALGVELAGSF